MRKFIRSLEISFFEIVILRIKGRTSPSPCTSKREIIRNLAISFFEIVILRIKRRGVSVPMYLDEENYTQPCDFPHRNPPIAYKGRVLDRENYTQPRDFLFRNPPIAYKGRGVSVPMYLNRENYTQPCDFPSSEFSFCV